MARTELDDYSIALIFELLEAAERPEDTKFKDTIQKKIATLLRSAIFETMCGTEGRPVYERHSSNAKEAFVRRSFNEELGESMRKVTAAAKEISTTVDDWEEQLEAGEGRLPEQRKRKAAEIEEKANELLGLAKKLKTKQG